MGIPRHCPSQVTVAGDLVAIPGEMDTPVVTPAGCGDKPGDTRGDTSQNFLSFPGQLLMDPLCPHQPSFPVENTRDTPVLGMGGYRQQRKRMEEQNYGKREGLRPLTVTVWKGNKLLNPSK